MHCGDGGGPRRRGFHPGLCEHLPENQEDHDAYTGKKAHVDEHAHHSTLMLVREAEMVAHQISRQQK